MKLMEDRSDVKAEEARAACNILGVENIYFFGADDAVLLVTEDMVRRLARLLREMRPDVVLTHFPKENDALTNSHAITGQIVMHAVSLAANVDPGDRRPPPPRGVSLFLRHRRGGGTPPTCGGRRAGFTTMYSSTSRMSRTRNWRHWTAW